MSDQKDETDKDRANADRCRLEVMRRLDMHAYIQADYFCLMGVDALHTPEKLAADQPMALFFYDSNTGTLVVKTFSLEYAERVAESLAFAIETERNIAKQRGH